MQWFSRLKQGLNRSSDRFKTQISDLFGKAKLEIDDLEQLEDALIMADFGVESARLIKQNISKQQFDKNIDQDGMMQALADTVAEMLKPVEMPLHFATQSTPQAVLVVGVNGSGKTTTIAKLAHQAVNQGKRVLLVAGDTFRAAAVEQLSIWAERAGCGIITAKPQGDAAGLVFDAMQQAEQQGYDLVLIDTAGRLHTKHNLMQELEKIVRVLRKSAEHYPQHTLLVLDGTTGQNAINQVTAFDRSIPLSGLVITKLDGTAKAGIVVALARQFQLPIHAIGVGEKAEDLQDFSAKEFAQAMFAGQTSDPATDQANDKDQAG